MILLLVGNDNKMNEMSTHCFGSTKLHLHCSPNNPNTILNHSLLLFSLAPTIEY
jgi:hypothetical protein